MTHATLAINGAFTLLLLLAAALDVRSRTISNGWPVALMLLFGLALILKAHDASYGNAIHFGIALAGGMALFALGWFGGGDAKLYAATALWFGLDQAAMLLLFVSLAGVIVLVVRMIVRPIQSMFGLSIVRGDTIPYGLAIAGGGIALIWLP